MHPTCMFMKGDQDGVVPFQPSDAPPQIKDLTDAYLSGAIYKEVHGEPVPSENHCRSKLKHLELLVAVRGSLEAKLTQAGARKEDSLVPKLVGNRCSSYEVLEAVVTILHQLQTFNARAHRRV